MNPFQSELIWALPEQLQCINRSDRLSRVSNLFDKAIDCIPCLKSFPDFKALIWEGSSLYGTPVSVLGIPIALSDLGWNNRQLVDMQFLLFLSTLPIIARELQAHRPLPAIKAIVEQLEDETLALQRRLFSEHRRDRQELIASLHCHLEDGLTFHRGFYESECLIEKAVATFGLPKTAGFGFLADIGASKCAYLIYSTATLISLYYPNSSFCGIRDAIWCLYGLVQLLDDFLDISSDVQSGDLNTLSCMLRCIVMNSPESVELTPSFAITTCSDISLLCDIVYHRLREYIEWCAQIITQINISPRLTTFLSQYVLNISSVITARLEELRVDSTFGLTCRLIGVQCILNLLREDFSHESSIPIPFFVEYATTTPRIKQD